MICWMIQNWVNNLLLKIQFLQLRYHWYMSAIVLHFRGELIIDTWKCYMYLFCSSHHVWQFCCLHVSSHLESTHVQNALKLLLWQGADIWNISYRNSVWWPNYIIKSVDKTKLSHITPHHHSTTVSLKAYPLYSCPKFSTQHMLLTLWGILLSYYLL